MYQLAANATGRQVADATGRQVADATGTQASRLHIALAMSAMMIRQ